LAKIFRWNIRLRKTAATYFNGRLVLFHLIVYGNLFGPPGFAINLFEFLRDLALDIPTAAVEVINADYEKNVLADP